MVVAVVEVNLEREVRVVRQVQVEVNLEREVRVVYQVQVEASLVSVTKFVRIYF